MKNYLQKHKKSDKVKWIFTFVGFLIILVMLVGMGLQLFGQNNLKPSEWFNKPNSEQASTNNGAKDGAIVNNGNSDCMQVASSKIAYADYEKNGISQQADTAYTLSATIKPNAAVDKTIKWSVAWQNGNSEWANDKNVTDYLTINTDTTQSGENITVTCLKDFGEVIEITACSSEDETKKAVCTVDYRKRIKSVNYAFQYDGNSMNNVIADSDGVYRLDYKNEPKSYTVVPTPVYSAYTIDCTYTSSIVGNFTDTFGYGNGISLNSISLLAGLNAPKKENELSERALSFIRQTRDIYLFQNVPLMISGSKKIYDSLSETEKAHSKVANAFKALKLCMDAFDNGGYSGLTSEVISEKNSIIDNYVAPVFYHTFMNNIEISSVDTFLQNCINCNNENKGIVEYEISYTTDDLTYQTKISLGFTTNTVGAVRGIEIDNGNLVI